MSSRSRRTAVGAIRPTTTTTLIPIGPTTQSAVLEVSSQQPFSNPITNLKKLILLYLLILEGVYNWATNCDFRTLPATAVTILAGTISSALTIQTCAASCLALGVSSCNEFTYDPVAQVCFLSLQTVPTFRLGGVGTGVAVPTIPNTGTYCCCLVGSWLCLLILILFTTRSHHQVLCNADSSAISLHQHSHPRPSGTCWCLLLLALLIPSSLPWVATLLPHRRHRRTTTATTSSSKAALTERATAAAIHL